MQLAEHAFSRSRQSNKPFAGIALNTRRGRRIRDVAISLLQRSGAVNDTVLIADAVAAATLKVRVEEASRDAKFPPDQLLTLIEAADKACAKFEPATTRAA